MPADVASLGQVQRRLLDALVPRLVPGGRLVYAVCTLTPPETRDVVAATGVPVVAELGTRPDRGEGEGFYAAVLAP